MRFTPKSESEIAADNLWPAGEYGFEVLDQGSVFGKETHTVERQSQNGTDMIQLVLKVYNSDGRFQTFRDFLMESMPGKLRHACEACGLLSQYETGVLTAQQFIGKSGYLKLKIEKDKHGQYPDKNAVHDYISPGEKAAKAANEPPPGHPAASSDFDDTIPF